MYNALLALSLGWVMWLGEIRLNYCPGGRYTCPNYCDIDHIHYQEDCNETKKEQEAYKQRLSESNPGITLETDVDSVTVGYID